MPNPARAPKPKRESIGCTLSPELAKQLHHEADSRMISPSILIENALMAYLPSLPPLTGLGGNA
jgi:hypothetical protein